ncbi:MAG TPA: HK97 family phage prohead protease [Thauera aminoaromatica]|nr:HK97 family phage prohead protease [Thauera aminoaromatica]
METKTLPIQAVHLKVADADMRFDGYASVFNGVDTYGDTITPGAFRKTLKKRERPVRMRWNHWGPVIGKWAEIEEDDQGLRVVGELTPKHSVAEDVYASLQHGAVDGLSIGYHPIKIENLPDGKRLLKEIHLVEVSVVEEPADLAARIADVKASLDQAESLKEIEALLREAAGFSRADATALVSRVKALVQRESGPNEAAVIADLIRRVRVA